MHQTITAEQRKQPSKASDFLYGSIGLLVVGWIFFGLPLLLIWSFCPDSLKYPVLYSVVYRVPRSRVQYDKKPVDCDWGHAPIGDKACHYEKRVGPTTNDHGRVTDVYVYWEKVQE